MDEEVDVAERRVLEVGDGLGDGGRLPGDADLDLKVRGVSFFI